MLKFEDMRHVWSHTNTLHGVLHCLEFGTIYGIAVYVLFTLAAPLSTSVSSCIPHRFRKIAYIFHLLACWRAYCIRILFKHHAVTHLDPHRMISSVSSWIRNPGPHSFFIRSIHGHITYTIAISTVRSLKPTTRHRPLSHVSCLVIGMLLSSISSRINHYTEKYVKLYLGLCSLWQFFLHPLTNLYAIALDSTPMFRNPPFSHTHMRK